MNKSEEEKIEPHEKFKSEEEELCYYGEVYKSALNSVNEINTALKDWLSHLLMIAATILGFLSALNPVKQTDLLCIRVCFLLAILLLVFVLLLGGVSLYGVVFEKRSYLSNFQEELGKSVDYHRRMKPIMPDGKVLFLICERCAYICFGLFFLVLIVYLILSLFVAS